ncbi:MAG: metallophosphoesterase [Planctomycetota bacterium]
MKLLHISDTHFGSPSHFNEGALDAVRRELSGGDYDAFIHSGDVTQAGTAEQYQAARGFLDEVEVPSIVTSGNHDARSGGQALFEEYIGSPRGVMELGDAVFIYVDSPAPDRDVGRLGKVKFNLIREALHEHHDCSMKVVVFHHHVIPVPMTGRERNVLANAGDLLNLLLRFDVDVVLGGHKHYPNVYDVENTVFVNAGTVSGQKTRYGDVNSYNVVEMSPDEVRVETCRLDGSTKVEEFGRSRRHVFHNFGRRLSRVVQLSNSFISNSRRFLRRCLRQAVKRINGLEPDVVVHCGGVVEEGILENYGRARQLFQNLEPPMVVTPAGRDLNYLGYHLFPRYMGSIDQHWSDEQLFLQGKCSSQYDSPTGVLGSTEREELFDRLEQQEQPVKGVFLHHNLVPVPHAREKGLLEDAGDLLRACVDSEVELVLTGTSSHAAAVRIGKTVIVNANSVSSIYQRSTFGHSFNMIDIYEDAIAAFEVNSMWGAQKLLGLWNRDSGAD